jgi:hypothetical protein
MPMQELPSDVQFLEFIGKFNTACMNKDLSFLQPLFPGDMPPAELASVLDFFHEAVGAVEKVGVEPKVQREGNRFEAVYEGDLGDGITRWANDFYFADGIWLKYDPAEGQGEPAPAPAAEETREPLVRAPESSDRAVITPLGYLDSRDELLGKTYAFAAYREENPNTGKWADHPSLRSNMSKAAVKGQDFIPIGFHLAPKEGDPRRIENRLYFDPELEPTRVEMHLVTRMADGSPTGEKILEFAWPAPPASGDETKQLIPLPKPSASIGVEQLGYVDSYDVIADKDYAYLAYRETRTDTGKWTIKIKAKSTAGASIDPNHPSFARSLEDAAKKGECSIPYGFRLTPKDADPRRVETLVHFGEDRKPSKVELHLVTRRADGSPKDERVMSFPWPSAD